MIKIILMFISAVPLFLHSPYLLQAWCGSRLDHWDWIFYILAAVAAVLAVRQEKIEKCDYYGLLLLIPMLFLTFSTTWHNVNALGVAAAAGVIYAVCWFCGSWKFAYNLLPAAIILLLGTPSSSYQLSLLLMCPVWAAWLVKFILAMLCFGWIYGNRRFGWLVKRGTLFFVAATICSGLLLLHTRELYFEGKSFVPEFSAHIGDYWGRSIQPDENTRRFFASSTVKQFRYTKNNTDISVLFVKCGNDIHEIHPASHCLRTSQWTVISEKILYLQDNFAVTEIDAKKGASRYLVWVWFSSDKFSTPGFLGFRKNFRRNGNYYTCQISIPVYNDINNSRAELKKFVNLLRKERQL